MPRCRIQYLEPHVLKEADRFDLDGHGWHTLREGDNPIKLLEDLVEDLNDDFSEFESLDDPQNFYWRLTKDA